MSIGKELAKARHKKGISIKDAEEATKIRAKFLEALEKDDFENVPEPVYIKGFIRTYATFLGANSFKLIKRYEASLKAEKEKQAALAEKNKGQNHEVRGCVVDPAEFEPKLILTQTKKFPWLALIFAVTAVILVLGVLGTLAPQPKRSVTVAKDYKAVPKTKKNKKKQNEQNKKESIKEPVINGIFISVIANKSTWIKVYKDGLLYFVGILQTKKKLKVHAVKNVEVLTVDGSALTIYKNHKFQGLMSKNKGPSRKSYIKGT